MRSPPELLVGERPPLSARHRGSFSASLRRNGLLPDVVSKDARLLERMRLSAAGIRAVRLVGGSLERRGKDWMAVDDPVLSGLPAGS
ncbi:MAG: hypothetical protein GEV06_14180 [Luteitalea sp.]|nr:hypothetical protein [Luteitalea sp.]